MPGTAVASPATAPTTSAAPAPVDLRAVAWADRDYPADMCGPDLPGTPPPTPIAVRGGVAPVAGSAVYEVRIGREVVYGDLTGDGRDEAVVPVSCGATGRPTPVLTQWVFTADPSADGLRRLTEVRPLDGGGRFIGRTDVRAAHPNVSTIGGRRLTTVWAAFGPSDPDCCPTLQVFTHLRWDGTALVADADPVVSDTGGQPDL